MTIYLANGGLTGRRENALPEMARRWQAKAHIDDNVCKPCKDNDGFLYKSRADAYADYPNGRGYKKCVGAQYGNTCRCKVMKRGRAGKGSNSMDLAALVAKAQGFTGRISARALAGPAAPSVTMQDFRAEGNTLYLYDAIGGWDGTKAIDVAQSLAGMTGPIDVRLNSPGGIIFEGAAIYNSLKQYTGGPITSYVDGYAASAASFVMLAASPYDPAADTGGVRFADNAFAMVHDGFGFAMGTADDMREVADLLDMLSDSIAAIYAARTGQTAEHWREIMTAGDTWYSAQGALDVKLADLIIGQQTPAEEPDEEEQAVAALDLFQPMAYRAETDKPADKTPFNFEGLREAMKGAFA